MPYNDPNKQREYQRQWKAKRRAEYLGDKSCVTCGSTQDLELDHIDTKSKINHRIWSWSKVRREQELAKCQVLCKSHHRERSSEQLRKPVPPHGTENRYNHHGCRCNLCRAAKSLQNALRY